MQIHRRDTIRVSIFLSGSKACSMMKPKETNAPKGRRFAPGSVEIVWPASGLCMKGCHLQLLAGQQIDQRSKVKGQR